MKLLIILLMLGTSLYATDVKYKLLLRNENAIYTVKASMQKIEAYAKLQVDIGFENGDKFRTIGILKGDTKNNIYPDTFTTDNYSNISKPLVLGTSGFSQLREFYYEKSFYNTSVKIGKMQSVWGKADGIKLLDVLNPQDFSEFILPSFDESRIPLWTLSLVHNFQNSELELLWILDTSYHKLAQNNADYAFSTPRFVPQAVTGIQVRQNRATVPDNPIKDSDIALRYSIGMDELEVSFYGLYAYDDVPVLYQDFDRTTRTININPSYERYGLLGMSADYSRGDFVYRVETAYSRGKYYLNTQSKRGVKKSDALGYVLGIDWYGLEQTLLSMQINQSFLLDNAKGYKRPKVDNTLTFLYKKEMLNDTLHAEALFIHNINDGDGLIRPKLSYEWDEETLLYTGVDYFYGDRDGLYGEFKDKSRIILGIERTF